MNASRLFPAFSVALAVFLVLSVPAVHAAADDIAKIYALPPAGSAYVRVVNPDARAASVQFSPDAASTSLSSKTTIATDYQVVKGGEEMALRVNGRRLKAPVRAPATGFATLVLTEAGDATSVVTVIDQALSPDGLKAELIFYNLTDCSASVAIQDGPTVFSNATPASRLTRVINPVSARLVGRCGTTDTPALTLPTLVPGDRFSLFLTGSAAAPILLGVTNKTEPYRAP